MGLFSFSGFVDKLKGTVGNALENDPDDVMITKTNLNRAGYFDEDKNDNRNNGFITQKLDSSIRSFQRDNNLKEDGKLFPGGETEQTIFKKLEKRDPFEIFGKDDNDSEDVGIGFGGNILGTLRNQLSEKGRVTEKNSFIDEKDPKPLEFDISLPENEPDLWGSDWEGRIGETNPQENAKENTSEDRKPKPSEGSDNADSKPVQYDATGRMITSEDNQQDGQDVHNENAAEKNHDDVFDKFRENLKPREGGIADRPKSADPGGLTNKGISQVLLDDLNTRSPELGLPEKPTDLTDEQIDTIFKTEFFERPQIGKLNDVAGEDKTGSKLVEHVFDAHVTTSPQTVGKWLQESIDETIDTDLKENNNGTKGYDGILGSKTRQALGEAVKEGKAKEINERFSDKRIEYMRQLKEYPDNKNGWERRVRDLRD